MNETMTENGSSPSDKRIDLDDGEQLDLLLVAIHDFANGHTQKTDLAQVCAELIEMRKDR